MPISLQVRNIEKFEKMGIRISGTKDALLASLVKESRRFGTEAVSISIKKYLSGPRPEHLAVGKKKGGRLHTSIRTKTDQDGSTIMTSIGTNIIYAAIHEMGGTTHPSVTQKMRAFAWRQFKETGDEKFKWLALTKKKRLTINIPARPYLRPAIEDALPNYRENIARVLGKINFVEGAGGE